METLESTNDIREIIELVERTLEPFTVAGVPATLVPNNTRLELHKDLLPAPTRLKQIVGFDTPESFIRYYNLFASPDSIIFCDLHQGKFTAVLDYHSDEPGWCEHVARYTCPKTPEWETWGSNSGTWMTQEQFAYFIEKNQEEILEPSGADMLEIALTLQAKSNVDFRRGIRLDNGQIQLVYQETIEGSAGKQGQIEIPSIIKVGLQLFDGGKGYEIEARFRYRVKDGNLVMCYELIRPHKAHEAAISGIYEHIDAGMQEGVLLRGGML